MKVAYLDVGLVIDDLFVLLILDLDGLLEIGLLSSDLRIQHM